MKFLHPKVSFLIELILKLFLNCQSHILVMAAPEGVARMKEAHPDVPIVTASLDERLNEKGYILPGLGDAGDRMFGTK